MFVEIEMHTVLAVLAFPVFAVLSALATKLIIAKIKIDRPIWYSILGQSVGATVSLVMLTVIHKYFGIPMKEAEYVYLGLPTYVALYAIFLFLMNV